MENRLRDFTRMNPQFFIDSKTVEDTQEFIEEVQKIFMEMRAKEIEKAELDSFQLMDIAYAWRKMWKDSRALAEVQSHCSLLRHHFWRGYSPERRESLRLRNSLNLSRA